MEDREGHLEAAAGALSKDTHLPAFKAMNRKNRKRRIRLQVGKIHFRKDSPMISGENNRALTSSSLIMTFDLRGGGWRSTQGQAGESAPCPRHLFLKIYSKFINYS